MRVKVKYMAVAREIAGTGEETIETENSLTIMDLLGLLAQKHGQRMHDYLFDPVNGKPRPYLQFQFNSIQFDGRSVHKVDEFKTVLGDESTLIIFPPVSGG